MGKKNATASQLSQLKQEILEKIAGDWERLKHREGMIRQVLDGRDYVRELGMGELQEKAQLEISNAQWVAIDAFVTVQDAILAPRAGIRIPPHWNAAYEKLRECVRAKR